MQVLHYKSLLHRFCIDILHCFRCACVLAYSGLLLVRAICSHNEEADTSHDKIQICTVLHWKTGIWSSLGFLLLTLFFLLVVYFSTSSFPFSSAMGRNQYQHRMQAFLGPELSVCTIRCFQKLFGFAMHKRWGIFSGAFGDILTTSMFESSVSSRFLHHSFCFQVACPISIKTHVILINIAGVVKNARLA